MKLVIRTWAFPLCAIILLISFLTNTKADASEYLIKGQYFDGVMRHPAYGSADNLYGYARIWVTRNGGVTVWYKFTSVRQIDGARFNALVVFRNKRNNSLKHIRVRKIIGPAGYNGKVEEEGRVASYIGDQNDFKNLHDVTVRFFVDEN